MCRTGSPDGEETVTNVVLVIMNSAFSIIILHKDFSIAIKTVTLSNITYPDIYIGPFINFV